MPRVFVCLAISLMLVLLGTAGLGLFSLHLGVTRHVVLGLFTLLLSCGVQAVSFMYLAVSGKAMVQAVHFGKLDPEPLAQSKRLKFRWTRLMAFVLVSAFLASASGAMRWRGGGSLLHPVAVMFLAVVHLWVLARQYEIIVANADLLDRTLGAYRDRKESLTGHQG